MLSLPLWRSRWWIAARTPHTLVYSVPGVLKSRWGTLGVIGQSVPLKAITSLLSELLGFVLAHLVPRFGIDHSPLMDIRQRVFSHNEPWHTPLYGQLGGLFEKKEKKLERFSQNGLSIYTEGGFYRTLHIGRDCV